MQSKVYWSDEYSYLGDNETANGELCPECEGGRTRERKFSVTRKDGFLLYNCYRASCGFSGSISVGGIPKQSNRSPKVDRAREGRRYYENSKPLSNSNTETILVRYGITSKLIGFSRIGEADNGRIVMPVLSRTGDIIGAVLRRLQEGSGPKALTFSQDDALSWYVRGSDRLLIVEDQLSAIRASEYLDTVALLGTNLNAERVNEILNAKYSKVYLALDKDAFAKTIKLVIANRSRIKLIPIILNKDVKDMNEEEIDSFMQELNSR